MIRKERLFFPSFSEEERITFPCPEPILHSEEYSYVHHGYPTFAKYELFPHTYNKSCPNSHRPPEPARTTIYVQRVEDVMDLLAEFPISLEHSANCA